MSISYSHGRPRRSLYSSLSSSSSLPTEARVNPPTVNTSRIRMVPIGDNLKTEQRVSGQYLMAAFSMVLSTWSGQRHPPPHPNLAWTPGQRKPMTTSLEDQRSKIRAVNTIYVGLGVIKELYSDWRSPVVLVFKPKGII